MKKYIKVKNSKKNKILLKCKNCGKVYNINTSTLEVYTDEVKESWKCVFCNTKEKKK